MIWRFHRPIDGILTAVHKRLAEGSNLKAGPFELIGQLRPQNRKTTQEKSAQEIQEALEERPAGGSDTQPTPRSTNPATTTGRIQAKYLRVEDLVLRALQAEYGTNVSRQVTAGADHGFDGAFVSNGRLAIVEVKYAMSLESLVRFPTALERIVQAVSRYGWRNVQIILAVVFERLEDVGPGALRLEDIATGIPIPVVIRTYSLAELEERFGLTITS